MTIPVWGVFFIGLVVGALIGLITMFAILCHILTKAGYMQWEDEEDGKSV